MKVIIPLTLLPGLAFQLHAATTSNQFVIGAVITDNDPIGFSDARQIQTPITSIVGVTVQLSMAGGWAGDMYAYVTHSSGFTVLLNRPGRTLADPAGSGVSGFVLTFGDDAQDDVHTAMPTVGAFDGYFQPDAREIDPDNSLDTSPRSAFLSSFDGLDGNGEWTLYVADVITGDQMTLNSWSLTIEGVPEPSAAILTLLGSLGLLRRRRVVKG